MMKLLAVAALAVLVICAREIKQSEAVDVPSCYDGASAIVEFTQYWVAKEGSTDRNDENVEITLTGPATKDIVSTDGSVIERTDELTYGKCVEEGTCILLNGDLVNLESPEDETFEVLDRIKFTYGRGKSGTPLAPFVSVAANDLDPGTTLFVSELENRNLPNGQTHNGCVRVDDVGVGFVCHIDWFVASYPDYVQLPNLPAVATVQVRTTCEILTYVA